MRSRLAPWIAVLAVGSIGACGNSASTVGTTGGCATGEVFCTTCGSGGFCGHTCPAVLCPSGDGGAGGDAAVADADACPSGTTSCLDCNGGAFCVSGPCPLMTCPVQDAGMGGDTGMGGLQSVCPGASPPPAGYPLCRSPMDCKTGATCSRQPQSGCGGCTGPPHECSADSDCLPTGARVCEPVQMVTCCGTLPGAQCSAKCTATTCAADTQCTATGHCKPTPCGQGYSCPSDRTCKPTDATADAHGCTLKLCTEGFACASDQECNPTSAGADPHGCAPKPCSSGYACVNASQCLAGPSADMHGCSPIPCSSGAPCGVNESCDPTQPGRGCVQRKCTSDKDCDCGACIQTTWSIDAGFSGTCQSSLWVCSSGAA